MEKLNKLVIMFFFGAHNQGSGSDKSNCGFCAILLILCL